MQRTERTRVLHHSSLGLHYRSCPEQISYSAVIEGRAILFPFFLYYAYPIILNDSVEFIYLFSAALFTVLTARC